ncbi:MAG: hypothetical protein P4N59_11430 [Negativicutes bacterium]|nr:hypothetical protein [Negativicutes bacterium]
MNLIAFDLGANMAFACEDVVHFPHWSVKTFKGHRTYRAADTLKWLNEAFDNHPWVDTAIYERPFARGQDATRCLWGIAGILEAVATSKGCTVLEVLPSTIKKWATGSGKADKEVMTAAAVRLGYYGQNEHEADAYCLYQYGRANIRVKENARGQ